MHPGGFGNLELVFLLLLMMTLMVAAMMMMLLLLLLLLLMLFHSIHPGDIAATLRLRACYLLSIHRATKTKTEAY